MILREFSKFIQTKNEAIVSNKTTATKLLCEWIQLVINKNPKNNAEKIVHKEIMLAENKSGDFLIVARSESGRILLKALYNFAQSYEHYIMSKWLSDIKPEDFQK